MWPRTVRFLTLVSTALALSLTSAHVLEMPQKMAYDAALYAAVNTTLYRYFASVGGVYSVGAVVSACALAWIVRGRRRSSRWALAGAICLVLWLVSWVALVQPVNQHIAEAMANAPAAVPQVYMQLRARWEYGHAVGFALEVLGFGALVWSVLVDTPTET